MESSSKDCARVLAERWQSWPLIARDRRSVTGRNVNIVSEHSGCDVWGDSPFKIKEGLVKADTVQVDNVDKWRVGYLGTLL